ncbi:MAG: chromosomal replication initiator protein DnaA [Brevinema sp.]
MTLWNSLLDHLLVSLETGFARPLLKRVHLKECQNDSLLILVAEDSFTKGWFEENCLPVLYEYLDIQGIKKEFRIELAQGTSSDAINNQKIEKAQTKKTAKTAQHHLVSDFTFNCFIPGDCNDFPYQASMNIAKDTSSRYNPFVISGSIGTGKTHLAQAIVRQFEELHPDKKTVYITSEDFTNEFIKHIQHKSMNLFREKYRHCDLLVIEDIQSLQERDSTSEELENIFNALLSRGSQMVFTSDKHIEKLKGLKHRLRTRLAGGLAVELKKPNFETRKAILLDMMERENHKADHKVIDFIAETIDDNIRSAKGTLLKMLAYADLKKKDISLKLAKEILSDKIKIDVPTDLSINEIQKAVAHYFGIKLSDIKSDSKLNAFARPRHIAMFIASKHTNFTSTEIGSVFGKAHSTVIRSYRKIEEKLPTDSNLKKQVDKIILELVDSRR